MVPLGRLHGSNICASSFFFSILRRVIDGIVCSLEIFALFMLTGVFSTLLIPETKQRTLEDLSNEDQHGFISGIAGDATDIIVPTTTREKEVV